MVSCLAWAKTSVQLYRLVCCPSCNARWLLSLREGLQPSRHCSTPDASPNKTALSTQLWLTYAQCSALYSSHAYASYFHHRQPQSTVGRRLAVGVITSLCLDTVSAHMGVKHLLLPAQLPGTHWVMICMIWHLALTVSNVCLKLGCFQSTSTYSTLEVSHFMRYNCGQMVLYLTVPSDNLAFDQQHPL